MPSPLMELAIGILCALGLLGMRIVLYPVTGDLAPYSFIFLAIVGAAVLGGWRSGLVALIVGQTLTWFLIVGSAEPVSPTFSTQLGGFAIVTIAQIFVLIVVAAYQREVARALADQDREMHLLSDALKEIDHRTKNNYQTVVSLILLQSQRSENPDVRKALAEAADRVRAVSLASDQLALRSEDLGKVRLSEHLQELCHQIRRGLVGDEVELNCEFADITTSADIAIHASIIVNELVTNALKHAFDEAIRDRAITIRCQPKGDGMELTIADNGRGLQPQASTRSGLGNRLVERFVQQSGGEHEIRSGEGGTIHRINFANVN